MIWSGFLLGLLGSLHCIGMCGPIAFLLPLDRKKLSNRIFQIVSYHSGRLFTYSLLGFLIGLVGKSLNILGFQQQLSIIVGVLMIIMVIIPIKTFNRYNFSKPAYRFIAKLKNAMGVELKKKDSNTFFIIGLLNGMLPCGLVYMAVFGALANEGITYSALYMMFFGLGTIPLMTTAVYMGNFLKTELRKKIVNFIPVFIVIVGVLFIIRGMGLGIKFVSPSNTVAIEKVSSKHSCH